MSYILGIDTGGTYTDAVVIDSIKNSIMCKSKALTTHSNLSKGIEKCINMLDFNAKNEIEEVHLATTIAVNSILENDFGCIGLLQIDKEVDGNVPAGRSFTIKNPVFNRKTTYGNKINEMDEIKKIFNEDVKFIIVTSPNGSAGIDREIAIAALLEHEIGVKAFSAAYLCDAEDYLERTVTALLNVYLTPIIEEWIEDIKTVLKNNKIEGPLNIVNALGELISYEEACEKPLKTVFSGLAASVNGGIALVDEKDLLLIDMGGTSSDITRIINRHFREKNNDTKIDKFIVREDTMDIKCYGIGGDSNIKINQSGEILVGPKRAIPLCMASEKYPHLLGELKACKRPYKYELITAQDVDCYLGIKESTTMGLTNLELNIAEYLKDRPHNIFHIAEHFNVDADELHMDRLVKKNVVSLISLTPTDILHVEGKFLHWDKAASEEGVKIIANRLGIRAEQFLKQVNLEITKKLAKVCLQGISDFEKVTFNFDDCAGASFLAEHFFEENGELLDVEFTINKPIVAVGGHQRMHGLEK